MIKKFQNGLPWWAAIIGLCVVSIISIVAIKISGLFKISRRKITQSSYSKMRSYL